MLRKRATPVVVTVDRPEPPRPLDGVETPYVLRFLTAWAWRSLVVIAAVWVFLQVFALLSVVLVPVIIGLLLSAVASPAADRLSSWGVPRGLATLLTIVTGLALIVALVALVAQQFSSGFGDLRDQFDRSLDELQRYLADLGLSRQQLQDFFDRVRDGSAPEGIWAARSSRPPRPPGTCWRACSSRCSPRSSSPTTDATSGDGSSGSSPRRPAIGSRAAGCVRGRS